MSRVMSSVPGAVLVSSALSPLYFTTAHFYARRPLEPVL